MGLSINDIVALAKQGYKPSDVKELISMSEEHKEVPDDKKEKQDNTPQPHEDIITPPSKDEPEGKPSGDSGDQGKELELQKENEVLKQQLSEIQKKVLRKDVSSDKPEDPQLIIDDIVRSFM